MDSATAENRPATCSGFIPFWVFFQSASPQVSAAVNGGHKMKPDAPTPGDKTCPEGAATTRKLNGQEGKEVEDE